jgi:hypothetical protein
VSYVSEVARCGKRTYRLVLPSASQNRQPLLAGLGDRGQHRSARTGIACSFARGRRPQAFVRRSRAPTTFSARSSAAGARADDAADASGRATVSGATAHGHGDGSRRRVRSRRDHSSRRVADRREPGDDGLERPVSRDERLARRLRRQLSAAGFPAGDLTPASMSRAAWRRSSTRRWRSVAR